MRAHRSRARGALRRFPWSSPVLRDRRRVLDARTAVMRGCVRLCVRCTRRADCSGKHGTHRAAESVVNVFISYAREDRDFVHALHDALVGHKVDVWVDWEDIPLTAAWL